ncbi:MAG: DUF2911 domain-containing protein [Bacteroidota bacterium]
MKKLLTVLLTFAVLMVTNSAIAQIDTPAPSPYCKMETRVGLTDIALEYSRPGVKGRTLFVDVEEFGKIWRTGANRATTIAFSNDVKIEGNIIPAGKYALYSIPDPIDWTIMLYKDVTLGGNTGKYDRSKEQARFKVKGYKRSSFVETFTIDVGDVKDDGATIAIKWGNWYVPFKLNVTFEDEVLQQIDAAMSGPSRGEFYTAAKFYYDNGKDMTQAHEWVKKANEKAERYWQLRLQAQIEQKLGMKSEAKATMQRSIAAAKSAGNMDYAKANEKMLKGWM